MINSTVQNSREKSAKPSISASGFQLISLGTISCSLTTNSLVFQSFIIDKHWIIQRCCAESWDLLSDTIEIFLVYSMWQKRKHLIEFLEATKSKFDSASPEIPFIHPSSYPFILSGVTRGVGGAGTYPNNHKARYTLDGSPVHHIISICSMYYCQPIRHNPHNAGKHKNC